MRQLFININRYRSEQLQVIVMPQKCESYTAQ